MRRISERRLEEAGFGGSVQEMVKMAPWWLISAVFHAVVLLIMWQIEIPIDTKPPVTRLQSDLSKEMEEPEVPLEEPEPEIPEEQIVEKIETEELSDHNEVDTDSEFEETAGEHGLSDAPFTGPSTNSAIGLGGGAGGGKRGRGGKRNLRAGGGSGLTENAVELGLKWLADHQHVDEDGKWDCDDFMKHDPADDKCDGAGQALHDVGVTGLAILAFLGAGYTDQEGPEANRHARVVAAGLRFLVGVQD